MAGRDITDGRANRSIAVDVGVVSSTAIWQNTDIAYDIAIGGMPFILATNNERPYGRRTAPFKKDQFDSTNQPGEQSLTGWWIRSQMSFHSGAGINFFDPATNDENGNYRFADSRGLDVWTKGQTTLLKKTNSMSGVTSGVYKIISAVSGITDVVVGYIPGTTTIKSFQADGTVVTTYAPTGLGNILDGAVCTDGTRLFIADADHIYVGPINSASAGWSEYYATGTRATLSWVKQRLVGGITNSIYELTGSTGLPIPLPTPVYTHPNTAWVWSSIAEGGSAIYAAGYAGTTSAIYKFVLNTSGAMPTLSSGIVAAQLPIGEYVNKIESYLGYLVIGTNKGVRIAMIAKENGDITYGPLVIESENIGVDFAFRNKFVWVTATVDGYVGLYRIDLGNELTSLQFAYATDAYLDTVAGYATSVDFFGNSNQIAFTTSSSNGILVQSITELTTSGYLTTGNIRYGTLEPKNFKRLLARGNFTFGSMTLETVDTNGIEYDHISYDSSVPPVEVTTSNPATAQEYVAYKFIMYRDSTDPTKGPVFKGYQAKATIATPRQRLVSHYVYCFDEETDKNNSRTGYSGRAYDRIVLLETIEEGGDIVTWQDLNTGESRQVQIEGINLSNTTPPDKNSTGFGGILEIVVRTV